MSTATGQANDPPVKGIASWSTPKKLRALLVLSWMLVVLLFVSGELELDSARHAMKTIGKDAAPSIIAAQEIGLALTDMDANVANGLLGNAAHRAAARRAVEQRRVALTKSIVDAAENITYGDAEKVPIQAILTGFGRYLELAAEARTLFERPKEASVAGTPGKDELAALAVYWQASDMLHRELLKAADDLDAANRTYLDNAYKNAEGSDGVATFFAVLFGGGLLAVLAYTQLFLTRRMRRMVNPALLLASFAAVGYAGYLVVRFHSASADLKLAKEDAFDSVHLLVKARTIAYDANADESRWLLDTSGQRGFEEAFKGKVRLLTTAPETVAPASKSQVAFAGLFADELKNITFGGEREAAAEMVRTYGNYIAIDREIRRLWRAGKRDAAIELCIGDRADQSNAAFERFDRALLAVLAINRAELGRAIDRQTVALKTAEIMSPLCAIAIAILIFLGLRPRLREYAA